MAAEPAVIGCHTEEQWTQQLQLAIENKRLISFDVVPEAGRLMIGPFWGRYNSNVIFLKVDVDELKTVAQDWAIEAMPTFIFLKDGTIVDKIVGARKDELPKKIEQHMTQ